MWVWVRLFVQDIVPTVPRLLGYSHVKHSVRLGANGELRIQDDAGVDVFGEGRGGLDVLQELSEKLQDKVRLGLPCHTHRHTHTNTHTHTVRSWRTR